MELIVNSIESIQFNNSIESIQFNIAYPNCAAKHPNEIGNGRCNGGYDTAECGLEI